MAVVDRGPFEDFASAEEEEDDEDDGEGSDLPRTNHEDSDVSAGRPLRHSIHRNLWQNRSLVSLSCLALLFSPASHLNEQ